MRREHLCEIYRVTPKEKRQHADTFAQSILKDAHHIRQKNASDLIFMARIASPQSLISQNKGSRVI